MIDAAPMIEEPVQPYEVDALNPMPLIHPGGTVISGRRLTVLGPTAYWSRVYKLEDRIVKQTTGGLARHEYDILRRLEGAHFPRALRHAKEAGYDVVEIELIEGRTLDRTDLDALVPPVNVEGFARACLEILIELKRRGIEHRDIRAQNMIVRRGRPVLIDFGWSAAPGLPAPEPPGLGAEARAPDGVSDAYAMATILRGANRNHNEPVDTLCALMMGSTKDVRIDDPAELLVVFDALRAPSETNASNLVHARLARLARRSAEEAAALRQDASKAQQENLALQETANRHTADTDAKLAALAEGAARTQSQIAALQVELDSQRTQSDASLEALRTRLEDEQRRAKILRETADATLRDLQARIHAQETHAASQLIELREQLKEQRTQAETGTRDLESRLESQRRELGSIVQDLRASLEEERAKTRGPAWQVLARLRNEATRISPPGTRGRKRLDSLVARMRRRQ